MTYTSHGLRSPNQVSDRETRNILVNMQTALNAVQKHLSTQTSSSAASSSSTTIIESGSSGSSGSTTATLSANDQQKLNNAVVGGINVGSLGYGPFLNKDSSKRLTFANIAPGTGISVTFDSTTSNITITNSGVLSFNGRTGVVIPVSGDYTTALVPDTTNKRYVTDNQLAALAGTSGTPSASNLFVTDYDIRLNETSLTSGGRMTVASTTTFNIAAGVGTIVNWSTGTPVETHVSWTAKTGITATQIANAPTSYVLIQADGSVYQTITPPTGSMLRQYILIGRLVHADLATLTDSITAPIWRSDTNCTLRDFMIAVGNIVTDGNVFYAPSASLNIAKTKGITFRRAVNYDNDYTNPNNSPNPAQNPCTFIYGYYNPTTAKWVYVTAQTNIDTTNYNLTSSGTGLTAMSNNKYQIQLLYHFPETEVVAVQYGEKQYDSYSDAVTGLSDSVLHDTQIVGASLRGALIFKKGVTDLSTTTSGGTTVVGFIPANRFCEIYGGAGATSASGVTSVTVSTPLQQTATTGDITITIQAATTSQSGYLSSTDWNTFNGKQTAYTILTTFGSLANFAGYLYNDGNGNLSYVSDVDITWGIMQKVLAIHGSF